MIRVEILDFYRLHYYIFIANRQKLFNTVNININIATTIWQISKLRRSVNHPSVFVKIFAIMSTSPSITSYL